MPTTTERMQMVEVAIEELRARGAGPVLDWFGERDEPQRLAWLERSAQVLAALLVCEPGRVEVSAALDGDWLAILPAAWAFTRLGHAHPAPTPIGPVTTLGRGDVTVFVGPLALHGRVKVNGMVVVVGALTIDGFLDHSTDPGGGLVVVGHERTRAMKVGWTHFVVGPFDGEVVYRSYASNTDGLFFVTGPAAVALEISDPDGDDELTLTGADGVEHTKCSPELLRTLLDPPPASAELDGLVVCGLVASGSARVKPAT